jgi:hypothetical protein
MTQGQQAGTLGLLALGSPSVLRKSRELAKVNSLPGTKG